MTQAVLTYDRYLADFRAFDAESAEAQPDWLRELRRQAIEQFARVGLPTARRGNEPWKYTNVGPIASGEFSRAAPQAAPELRELAAAAPWDDSWRTIVFVDGRYSAALSANEYAGARALNMTEALVWDEPLVREHLAQYAPFDYDGFTALNTAFLSDGAVVYVPDGEEIPAPLHVLHVSTTPEQVAYPRTLVIAGPLSKVTVIETYLSLGPVRAFTDAVTEISVGDGAHVEHYRLMLERDAYHVGVSRVRQSRDSTFTSMSFASGPHIGRNDFSVLLDAPGAECYMRGLYVTSGNQHIDNYLSIDHAKPHGMSRLYYKGILDDRSRAVFGGTVFVRPGADKTDAHQEDKNLVLSAEAEVDSKPALEIYADDVKCGHGATAGAVAEDAIFYMRSRGLDDETAQIFLIKGFASEILDAVAVEPLRVDLEGRTARALPRFQRDVAKTFHLLDPRETA